ncbi:Gfo/Idh/MocA family protein [Pedosphaera parvula]|uniref:Oxidoreductase domain protein n=1 Tax=Pedosphaera parvula (strain Ellin514) TaxID=320771 RepID=B9XF58_PEDPL|nr:Gfo/Idh/MocA family oxidoreductase [Pedosphaera parvula]EEF61556.1 oxidoreductase domain protein [Pedosphaera parvula Ellin514]
MSNNNTPSSNPIRIEVPSKGLTRRHFIYTTALAASSLALSAYAAPKVKYKSPNEKLNIGLIGVGGKGEVDSEGMSGENIIAMCDVDSKTLAKGAKKWPGATQYRDFRKMIESNHEIDAVTVSIPDHQHAPAAMMAIKAGKHVYCQKPLTHTIWEARELTLAARKYKVATQMGNQGHSGDGNRRLCEMVWSGAIGNVLEAHCWTNRPIWPQGRQRPAGSDPVPAHLDWDSWIGPAPMRPFKDKWPAEPGVKQSHGGTVYHPFAWRGWWDFGCGALGDMGCHVMDGANWALKLGAPTSVELVDASPINNEMAPSWSIIRLHFPKRGDLPACTLTWYDGGKLPARPAEMEAEKFPESGTLLIGDKGKLMCDTYGERPRLLPESSMVDFKKPEPTIPRVPNNSPYDDFIRACKGGPAACSNFDVSGPFTETVLLGNLVLRMGKNIEWDCEKMRVKGMPEADQYIKPKYRKGWKV